MNGACDANGALVGCAIVEVEKPGLCCAYRCGGMECIGIATCGGTPDGDSAVELAGKNGKGMDVGT